ncbi:hypothetical protein NDU88_003194 [Pleurodeles waltl]|uniref:Uncharacterized protein n=1 Tax=Pleurodeles waltl TaxID=8319 RepID=A0AAV7T4M9_PLEWA|nr:hypothetical protein NDU88_003194 [Pleurodeles waltl]
MADGAGRFHTAPPHKGQSTLVPGRPGRRESRRRHPWAPGKPTPALRLCVPQGGVPKADSSPGSPGGPPVSSLYAVLQPGGTRFCPPSRGPTRHRQAPPPDAPICTPPFRMGPRPNLTPGTAHRPIRDLGRNPAATSWVQARAGAHKSVGGCPRGRGRAQAAPGVPAAHLQCSDTGSLPAQRVPAPPVDRAAASLLSPGQPQSLGSPLQGARPHLRGPPPSAAVVPLLSGHETARFSASRHQFKVGPSGAKQLSVRLARLRGHAPAIDMSVAALLIGVYGIATRWSVHATNVPCHYVNVHHHM